MRFFTCTHRALIRPGRLEEHIALSLPTERQRRACLVALFDPEARDWLCNNSSGDSGAKAVQRNKEVDDIARYTELRYTQILLFA